MIKKEANTGTTGKKRRPANKKVGVTIACPLLELILTPLLVLVLAYTIVPIIIEILIGIVLIIGGLIPYVAIKRWRWWMILLIAIGGAELVITAIFPFWGIFIPFLLSGGSSS